MNMVINCILVVVGLTICFGGIDLKRLCYALVGFYWGGIGTIVGLMIFGGFAQLMDGNTLLYILLGALVFALISAAYNKLCAAINGFLSTFSISFISISLIKPIESSTTTLGIAAIIGLIFAIICYKFYEFTIIVITAFSGGIIAMLGVYGLMHNSSPNELLSMIVFFDHNRMGMILIGTAIMGLIGIGVQYHRLNKKRQLENDNTGKTEQTDLGIISEDDYSENKNDGVDNNVERTNYARLYVLPDRNEYVDLDFNDNTVFYKSEIIGTYVLDSNGDTVVTTKTGIQIQYTNDNNENSFCTFINLTKNKRLAEERGDGSLFGYELVGPSLQLCPNLFETKDDELLGKFYGDRNGAIAAFVCCYTESFSFGEFYTYFVS